MGITVFDQPGRLALVGALCAFGLVPAPAHAATGSGSGEAVIVTPLSLVNTAPLSFGNIVPSGTAGTVTINQNSGTRTQTGGATLAGGAVSRASFTGLTGGWGVVQVTIPAGPVTLTRPGGGSMSASLLLSNLPGFTLINQPTAKVAIVGSGNVFSFSVGGTLNVGANQPSGVYSATFNVTANYF